MKTILVFFGIVTALGSIASAKSQPSCGGDGDGSALFYCESANHDISIDGLFSSDGTNTAKVIFKLRDHGQYVGSESYDMNLSSDTSYQQFNVSGATTDKYSTIKLKGLAGSVHEICPDDSATFTATLIYKVAGVSDSGRTRMNCSYYTAH